MLFGTDAGAFSAMAPLVALTSYRGYNTPARNVPAAWPGPDAGTVPAGVVPVISFNPDTAAVLSGALDAQLEAFFKSAPPGSRVTAHHEGNDPGNHFTSQDWTALQRYCADVCEQANPGVSYGQIFGTYPVQADGQDLRDWVCPGLRWYGLDGYQHEASWTPESVFGGAWNGILAVEPDAELLITETNSKVDPVTWFPAAFEWAAEQKAEGFATWWGSGPQATVFPFDPANTALVSVLRGIAVQAAQC